MALFKPYWGSEEDLNKVTTYHDGFVYFTIADSKCLFVDYGGQRYKINAEEANMAKVAEKVRYQAADSSYVEIDIEDLITNSDIIPITNGGTGATNAAGARANLDVYSKTEVNDIAAKGVSKSYTATLLTSGWVENGGIYQYNYANTSLTCGKDGNIPPVISFLTNQEEYSKITSAIATPGTGIVFEIPSIPTENIGIIIIDVK